MTNRWPIWPENLRGTLASLRLSVAQNDWWDDGADMARAEAYRQGWLAALNAVEAALAGGEEARYQVIEGKRTDEPPD